MKRPITNDDIGRLVEYVDPRTQGAHIAKLESITPEQPGSRKRLARPAVATLIPVIPGKRRIVVPAATVRIEVKEDV